MSARAPAPDDSGIQVSPSARIKSVDQRSAEAEFAAFYRRTFPHVWSILGRNGIREKERCDVAQNVYAAAFRRRAQRPADMSEMVWVGILAWRRAQEHHRNLGNQRARPVDDPEDIDEPIAPGASPEDLAISREYFLLLMEGMDPDRRMVFDMHAVEGMSHEEIAAALGKPLGTVKTWLRAAQAEILATRARLAAREAHAERKAHMPAAILPFGAGAWASIGRAFEDAPDGMAERVWRGVSKQLGLSAATAAGAAAGAGAGAAMSGKLAAALLGTGIVLGGGGVELFHRTRAEPSPTAAEIVPEVAKVAPAVTATASAAGSEPESAPVTVTSAPASTTAQRATPPSIDPEEEALLNRASAALVRQRFDDARRTLDEHARRFPNGSLKTERERRRAQLAQAENKAAASSPDAGRAPHRLLGTDD